MKLIPSEDEQVWLIDRLAKVIAGAGPTRFLETPLLHGVSGIVPTPWRDDPEDVWLLAKRLLRWAGLDDAPLEIELVEPHLAPDRHAVLWYPDGDSSRLSLNLTLLGEPAQLLQNLAWHAVGVWVAGLGVEVQSRNEFDALAEICATYLGLGLLRLDCDFQTDSMEQVMGNPGVNVAAQPFEPAIGLPLSARSFLLAVHCAVRHLSDSSVSEMSDSLGTDQAACFEEAWRELRPWRSELIGRLNLQEDHGKAALAAPDLCAPFAEEPRVRVIDDLADPGEIADSWRDVDKVVLREARNERSFRHAWLILPAVAIGLYLLRFHGLPLAGAIFIVILGGICGMLLSPRQMRHYCSDATCGAFLPVEAEHCPGCGGRISPQGEEADPHSPTGAE